MNEQQLLDLKKQMDKATEKATELSGQQKQLMGTLESDWSCKTVDQAEKKVEKMDTEITQLNNQIKKGTEELEEKYTDDE